MDVNPETVRAGSWTVQCNPTLDDDDVFAMPETCSLDVADRGEMTLDALGQLLGVTRERVRQIQNGALVKLRLALEYDEGESNEE